MKPNRCGTHLGYRDHHLTGEPTCQPCRDAQAAWQREYEKRRYLARGCLLIDAAGTRRRLQALAVMGWPSIEMSARMGSTRSYASALMYKDRVQRRTAEKVARLYDELSMEAGPSTRATTEAKRKGWVGPLAWNDDEIDDPAAQPAASVEPIGPLGRRRDLELEERVLELTASGRSAAEIAIRLRTNERYVARVRARYRDVGEIAS